MPLVFLVLSTWWEEKGIKYSHRLGFQWARDHKNYLVSCSHLPFRQKKKKVGSTQAFHAACLKHPNSLYSSSSCSFNPVNAEFTARAWSKTCNGGKKDLHKCPCVLWLFHLCTIKIYLKIIIHLQFHEC